ncbi:hypothetical protein [Enterococcus alishanensis]
MKNEKLIVKLSSFLNFFIGIGAFVGSLMAFIPAFHESMGLSTAMLQDTPFKTFLIPGLFLLFILGGLNILNGICYFTRQVVAYFFSFFMGVILMIWIVIQCLLLQMLLPIQAIFFLLGFLQTFCSVYSIRKRQLIFPSLNK